MNKLFISVLICSLLTACGESKKLSDLPNGKVETNIQESQNDSSLLRFRPERVSFIVKKIVEIPEDKFLTLDHTSKFSLVSEAFKSFENMTLDDYYKYSPDQADVTGGGRGYSKEEGDKYGIRMSVLMKDIQIQMTPDQMSLLKSLQLKIPYLFDIEKQKLSSRIFLGFTPIKDSLEDFVKESGHYPVSKDELKNVSLDLSHLAGDKIGVQDWQITTNGVIEIRLSENIFTGGLVTMIPYRKKNVDTETGKVNFEVEWKCMISPPQASKYKPDGCDG
ncbi:MAG TPA: hypothetical protein VIY47_15320 [Ignavibacteriaceae bacterium]